MMSTFRVTDALRCLVLNTPKTPNLACPRSSPSKHATLQNLDLWKQALTQQDNRITLASWNGIRLGGLVSARTCTGRVWEVDHLYFPQDESLTSLQESGNLELLEQLVQQAGVHSVERILLRLPSGIPAITLARRTGFFPYFEETLLEGTPGAAPSEGELSITNMRARHPQDDYSLFQLFSASTPASVRVALGLTCDQWQGVQSLLPGNRHEWVYESKGKIVGWLGLFNCRGTTEGKLMAHPDHPDLVGSLLKLALSHIEHQRWLVPDYQSPVCNQLKYHGLQEAARYTMLINTVAAPVRCAGMAPVEA